MYRTGAMTHYTFVVDAAVFHNVTIDRESPYSTHRLSVPVSVQWSRLLVIKHELPSQLTS